MNNIWQVIEFIIEDESQLEKKMDYIMVELGWIPVGTSYYAPNQEGVERLIIPFYKPAIFTRA